MKPNWHKVGPSPPPSWNTSTAAAILPIKPVLLPLQAWAMPSWWRHTGGKCWEGNTDSEKKEPIFWYILCSEMCHIFVPICFLSHTALTKQSILQIFASIWNFGECLEEPAWGNLLYIHHPCTGQHFSGYRSNESPLFSPNFPSSNCASCQSTLTCRSKSFSRHQH